MKNKQNKLDKAIKRAISVDGILSMKGNNMADNDQKIKDAQEKVDAANQKKADARPGNVVSTISAFGTPSTHEDPYDERGKSIAQLPEEGDAPKQDERFDQDQESVAKATEERVEEEVADAEAAAQEAEVEAKVADKEDTTK